MTEVSKEEFFRLINEGHLDVIEEPRRIDCGVYEHIWRLRNRTLFGKTIPQKELDRYPYYVTHYYVY